MELNKIYNMDCMDGLKLIENNSIDSVVTDPPYEIGFMNNKWDNNGISNSVEFWKEVLRVLKPGGHLLSFSSARTYHRQACAVEDAGFEIRDMIEWVYGSGFPKSLNVQKAIDKSTDDISIKGDWRGFGTGLKPAHEPILMARKPLACKNVISNISQYGAGAINIDGCRIEYEKNGSIASNPILRKNGGYKLNHGKDINPTSFQLKKDIGIMNINELGRFPANLIHDGSDDVLSLFPESGNGNGGIPYNYAGRIYDNKDTSMFNGDKPAAPSNFNDYGSSARFFYCAKASRKERNENITGITNEKFVQGNYSQSPTCKTCNKTLNGTNNHSNCSGEVYYKDMKSKSTPNNHPTVKPLSLMRYLCRLVTPRNGLILDPFMGSGTTALACIKEGMDYIGFELEKNYFDIANARIIGIDNESTNEELKFDI